MRSMLESASTYGKAASTVHFPRRRRSICLSFSICSSSSTTSSSGAILAAAVRLTFWKASTARSRISWTASLIVCISSVAFLEKVVFVSTMRSAHSAIFCAWSAMRSNSPHVCSSSDMLRFSLSDSSRSPSLSRYVSTRSSSLSTTSSFSCIRSAIF